MLPMTAPTPARIVLPEGPDPELVTAGGVSWAQLATGPTRLRTAIVTTRIRPHPRFRASITFSSPVEHPTLHIPGPPPGHDPRFASPWQYPPAARAPDA